MGVCATKASGAPSGQHGAFSHTKTQPHMSLECCLQPPTPPCLVLPLWVTPRESAAAGAGGREGEKRSAWCWMSWVACVVLHFLALLPKMPV